MSTPYGYPEANTPRTRSEVVCEYAPGSVETTRRLQMAEAGTDPVNVTKYCPDCSHLAEHHTGNHGCRRTRNANGSPHTCPCLHTEMQVEAARVPELDDESLRLFRPGLLCPHCGNTLPPATNAQSRCHRCGRIWRMS